MSTSKTPRKSLLQSVSTARQSRAASKIVFRACVWRLLVLIAVLCGGLAATKSWWVNASIGWLAHRSLAAREPEQALVWIYRGAGITNSTGDLWLLRARAHRHLGQLNEVKTSLDQAAKYGAPEKKLRRENDLAMAQAGQFSAVETKLPKLLIDADDDTNEVCEAFVIGYMRTLRFGDALPLIKAWIADSPMDPEPLLLRSRVWMVEHSVKRAEADLQRAHELAPRQSEIAHELAIVLQQQNRWSEAVKLHTSCLNDKKWSAKAKLGLGLCHKALGDAAASEKFLTSAAQEAPQNAEALREYGRHLDENGHYAEAAEVLRRAIDLMSYDDELHYLLAQALQSLGDREGAAPHFAYVSEARAAFRELQRLQDRLRKEPQNIDLLTQAGEILLRYSDPQEGVVRLMAVLDQQPTQQRARQLLADYYSKRAVKLPEFAFLAEEHRRWLRPSAKEDPGVPFVQSSDSSP